MPVSGCGESDVLRCGQEGGKDLLQGSFAVAALLLSRLFCLTLLPANCCNARRSPIERTINVRRYHALRSAQDPGIEPRTFAKRFQKTGYRPWQGQFPAESTGRKGQREDHNFRNSENKLAYASAHTKRSRAKAGMTVQFLKYKMQDTSG